MNIVFEKGVMRTPGRKTTCGFWEKIGELVCGGIMNLITNNTWDCTHKNEKRVTRKDCKESDRHNQT
jgi:hypothetical protein